MNKQTINIVGVHTLYNIFEEIKDNLSFNVANFDKEDNFLKLYRENKIDIANSLILTKAENKDLFVKKNNIDKQNIFLFYNKDNNYDINLEYNLLKYPIEIYSLIEKINIQLIKQKYNYQSKIKLNDYYLDLNSRNIAKKDKSLKLTEREMDIILFLNDKKKPQKINILQSQVWEYSSDLETHTVETHIYRLRKKINNKFKDNKFIISTDEGYIIK
jgi:hypothetical protein|tara:strand:- start:1022 stop:1669 length:648 start_codon:yes stop_codon:yes gene_type:complete